MNFLLRIASAAAFIGCASVTLAQHGNGSDYSGPISSSLAGGAFVPMPAANGRGGPAAGSAAAASVSSTAQAFSIGTPTKSPVTGKPIPPAALRAVGNLIASGSPASVATVGSALTSGGAPSASVSDLTQALSALAGVTGSGARAAIVAAANSYNALVARAPVSFLAQPPADFLAIQAALANMVGSLKR